MSNNIIVNNYDILLIPIRQLTHMSYFISALKEVVDIVIVFGMILTEALTKSLSCYTMNIIDHPYSEPSILFKVFKRCDSGRIA